MPWISDDPSWRAKEMMLVDSDRLLPADLFAVDTSHARPPEARAGKDHLEDLLGLRGLVTRLSRRLHDLEVQTEESLQQQRQETKRSTTTAVAIVDELRLLVLDARANQSKRAEANPSPRHTPPRRRKGLRHWLGLTSPRPATARSAPPKAEADEDWLSGFERFVSSAISRLADIGIQHIPLLGRDVRTLEYEGRPLKSWISVKNPPRGDALVVARELAGLWVSRSANNPVLVQRGEVLVREEVGIPRVDKRG